MADITITHEPARALTVFTIRGIVLPSELIRAIEQTYGQEDVGDSLWDFTEATLGAFENDELFDVAGAVQNFADNRRQARTVIVTDNHMEGLIGKLYALVAQRLNSPVVYHIAYSQEDAYAWLDRPGETPG